MGAKAREVEGFKLWYSGSFKARNEVGILVERELIDFVFEVRQKSDRIMAIKVLVGSEFINIVSVYAPQIGLPDDIKRFFWEELDMASRRYPVVRSYS